MSIKISKQKGVYIIEDGKSLTFQDLQANIIKHFGFIKNLSEKITYKQNDKKQFINDDVTLKKAMIKFPKELLLNIQNQQEIKTSSKLFLKIGNEEKSIEDWAQSLISQSFKKKLIQSKKEVQYLFDQIDQYFFDQINKFQKKTQRFGHSQDLVGSFFLSCYHQKSKQQNLSDDEIDKSLWKLQEWRQQKRKKLKKQQKSSYNKIPALKKPSNMNGRKRNGQNLIFRKINIKENIPSEVGGVQKQDQQMKYYFYDQIYQKLSEFQKGIIQKQSLSRLLTQIRQYSDSDMRFVIKVFQAFAKYSFKGIIYHPPVNQQSGVLKEFQDNEVVAILGDWGTGEADAFSLLDEVVRKQKATIVLHNGDVYYAGFPNEYQRLSSKINQLQKQFPNLRFYTIPGNHDYYSYGGPFYDHLKNNHLKKQFNQQFGFFCLKNKSNTVQFIGLNTGKNEHSMLAPVDFLFEGTYIQKVQVDWAIKKIKQFPGKSILITHHQLFSTFQEILGSKSKFGVKNPQLNCKMSPQLFEIFPKLTCWIWGHEHRFSTFNTNSYGVNRCILAGNSAFQNNQKDYYKIVYPADDITVNKYHPEQDKEDYYHHTAVILKNFNQASINAKYVYMTSSYNKPAVKTREEEDTIDQPFHVDITYGTTFQIIQQSGLSFSSSSYGICLDAQPANLQFVDPMNSKRVDKLEVNKQVLIKNQNSGQYLRYINDFIDQGDYQKEQSSLKQKYLWKLIASKSPLSTGDIFRLYNVSNKGNIQKYFNNGSVVKLKVGQNASRFFIYSRKTKNVDIIEPQKTPCCNIF